MLKPLNQTGFEQIQYFALTNFDCLVRAMELGLNPIEYRTLQYFYSCWSHKVEIIDTEAAEFLGITLVEFYDIAEFLDGKNLIDEIIFLGGTENENV